MDGGTEEQTKQNKGGVCVEGKDGMGKRSTARGKPVAVLAADRVEFFWDRGWKPADFSPSPLGKRGRGKGRGWITLTG